MNTLLVFSTGISDVQLVVDGVRQVFSKKCGPLHDEIATRVDQCNLVETPLEKGGPVVNLPNEISLCTPKLDAVMRYLTSDVLVAVLILETTRKHRFEEPRFAGEIIERRLRDLNVTNIVRCAYLDADDKDYSDKSNPKDAIVRRAVVARIDDAVRNILHDTENSTKIDKVIISSTGGMSTITSLIDEIVLLHARTKEAKLIEIEDGSKSTPPEADYVVSRSQSEPHESFRSRRHALDLITRGNLLAAWGAVEHLAGDEDEQKWTKVVRWMSQFAASLPIDTDCDISLLNHKLKAVRSALRVEFALRAGDVPRAIHGTVAFFESALCDHLTPRILGYHPTKPKWCQLDLNNYENLIHVENTDALSRRQQDENNKRPFHRVASSPDYYLIFDDKVRATQLAEKYLDQNALTALSKLISTDLPNLPNSSIRDLRNDVVHNEPTPEKIKEANQRMVAATLWQPEGVKMRFLSVDIVTKVLQELDITDLSAEFNNLLDDISKRLLAP